MEITSSTAPQEQEIEETGENFFKQFDIVTDFSDHHYAKHQKDEDGFLVMKTKRIFQEWKMLEKDLPESIHVRVYEERVDVLRAVMVGAAGTPYHDGLFFFDLRFPSDYPSHPPEVYYHSHGFRINPNLYANGRVCLSLLNTWTGKKNEKWNSSESTVLQVLVSIQALVLNEKPYYNEPINGVKPGWQYWEKKSLAYNEEVFGLNIRTMLITLTRPPMHFKELVSSHFRERAHGILVACKAYVDGNVNVGMCIDIGSSSSSTPPAKKKIVVSRRFKESMEFLYPKAVTAFSKNGASVEHFVEQLMVEKENTLAKPKEVGKVKVGFGKNLFNKVKKILGFKVKKTGN